MNPVYELNRLFESAINHYASDIHFHPLKSKAVIKFRVDGELLDKQEMSIDDYALMINRIKVLANLSSTNSIKPMDGRFSFTIDNRMKDLRISVVPSLYGDNVVVRILSEKKDIPSIEEIGLSKKLADKTKQILDNKEGLLLVVGPTGSGKTTTVYSMLNYLYSKSPNMHIVTIEDPIEYQYPEFTQIQVNEKIELSFSEVLRAVLRQDPDIILIGEIRDENTARIAVRASLTGHLVFATIHSNDNFSSINRFLEFRVNPNLFADSLLAVYSQRLDKQQCFRCKGNGCKKCFGKGYSGRQGDFKLLVNDDKLKSQIKNEMRGLNQ